MWAHVHAHDIQNGRMSRFQIVKDITGGYSITVDDSNLFDKFCSMSASRRLSR